MHNPWHCPQCVTQGTGMWAGGSSPAWPTPSPASPLAGHGRLAFSPATLSSKPLVSSVPQCGGSGGRRCGHTHTPEPKDWPHSHPQSPKIGLTHTPRAQGPRASEEGAPHQSSSQA